MFEEATSHPTWQPKDGRQVVGYSPIRGSCFRVSLHFAALYTACLTEQVV